MILQKLKSKLYAFVVLGFITTTLLAALSPLAPTARAFPGLGSNYGECEDSNDVSFGRGRIPEDHWGDVFAVMAPNEDAAEGFLLDGDDLSGYNYDYHLSGGCQFRGTTSATQGASHNFTFGLYPTTANPRVWRGYAIRWSSTGGVPYITGLEITFAANYSTYNIRVMGTGGISEGDIENQLMLYGSFGLGVSFDSANVGLVTSGSHQTSDFGGGTVLTEYRGGGGGGGTPTPGTPTPTPSDCEDDEVPLCGATINVSFVTRATIQINSITFNDVGGSAYSSYPPLSNLRFFDRDIGGGETDVNGDNSQQYVLEGSISANNTTCSATARINLNGNPSLDSLTGSVPATLSMPIITDAGACTDVIETEISVSNPVIAGSGAGAAYASDYVYVQTDANTIRRVDAESGDEWTYVLNTGQQTDSTLAADVFVSSDDSENCRSYITMVDSQRLSIVMGGSNRARTSESCVAATDTAQTFYFTGDASAAAPGGGTTDPTRSEDDIEPTCESAIDNGFGWLICPFLDIADRFISTAEDVIREKLAVGTSFLENESLRNSWLQIARISSGMLVIIGLVMIISTALGSDMISSYSLKKVLPRLALGAIGIWLSWTLASTYVIFMNDLGRGIGGLLWSPWSDTYGSFEDVNLKEIVTLSFDNSGIVTDLAATGIFTVGFIGALAASGGVLAILASAIPIVGAMLFGFIFLALREIIIIFLIVIAPIAVAAWILPNTNKVWKIWSGTFNKLLLLFPLFMGIFAAGKIFAIISAEATGGENGVIEVVIPMVAYVAPFFFLPLMYKLGGSLFQNLTGMVNNRGKGMFDKLSGNLRTKSDANRKLRDAEKLRMAQTRIANQQGNFRDRWRTGTSAVGVSSTARAARRRAMTDTAVQGYKAQAEDAARQTVTGADGTVRTVAEEQARLAAAATAARVGRFDPRAEQAKVEAAELKVDLEAAELRLQGDITTYNDPGALEALATNVNATLADRRAALNRLTQMKQTEALGRVRTNLQRTAGGSEIWDRHLQDNFKDTREFAPHLAPVGPPGSSQFAGASAEAAAKWNAATWDVARASDPAAAARLAAEVRDNDRLNQTIGENLRNHLDTFRAPATPPTPPPGAPPAPPPVRQFTAANIAAINPDLMQRRINTAGGTRAMHTDDLRDIANTHGGHAIGTAAADELRRRGIII